MTTLLTIGYGDIHAAGQAARALVLVQMVFNVAILATASTTLTPPHPAARAERGPPRPGVRVDGHAAEPDVRRRVPDAVALPRGRAVALAVVRRAQV